MRRIVSVAVLVAFAAVLALSALAASKAKNKPTANESQKGGLPALEDRVDKLEGEVGALQTAVAALQSAVSALQSAVSALQSAVSTLQSEVATITTAVTDLQGQNNWAVVDSSGHVVRASSNSVTAAKIGPGAGVYEVTFGKDVHNCAYVATIGDTGHAAPSPGQITVSGDVDGNGSNPKDVQVQTFDKSGTAADASFQVYVSCP